MTDALPKTKGAENPVPVVVALKPFPRELAGSKCAAGANSASVLVPMA